MPFYSPQARIHACVVPFSGHVVSLSINHRLQAADAVAWSSAFIGQRKFHERCDSDEGHSLFEGLPGMTISRATVAAATETPEATRQTKRECKRFFTALVLDGGRTFTN